MVFSPKRKWKKSTLPRNNEMILTVLYVKERSCYNVNGQDLQQQHYTQKLTQKQWEQLFLSLYKNTKQKDAFDIQYKFQHFVQPSLTRLREIGQNYEL